MENERIIAASELTGGGCTNLIYHIFLWLFNTFTGLLSFMYNTQSKENTQICDNSPDDGLP